MTWGGDRGGWRLRRGGRGEAAGRGGDTVGGEAGERGEEGGEIRVGDALRKTKDKQFQREGKTKRVYAYK